MPKHCNEPDCLCCAADEMEHAAYLRGIKRGLEAAAKALDDAEYQSAPRYIRALSAEGVAKGDER